MKATKNKNLSELSFVLRKVKLREDNPINVIFRSYLLRGWASKFIKKSKRQYTQLKKKQWINNQRSNLLKGS